MNRRLWLLGPLLMVALAQVACGGGNNSDGASPDDGGGAASLKRVTSLTTQAVEDLGVDGAFDAAMFALERGYSPAQVVAAVEGSRLLADGMLASDSSTEAPDGPALGLVQLPDSAMRTAKRAHLVAFREPVSVEVAREEARAAADELNLSRFTDAQVIYVWFVLLLLTDPEGYTGEEIVQALIFRQLPKREQMLSSARERTRTASPNEAEAETAEEAADAQEQGNQTSPDDKTSQEDEDCPGLTPEVCAHSGTHVYTQQSNREACPEANPITEGTDYTITFEAGGMTVHSHHFGWTFMLEQTSPTTFVDATRTWEFNGPTITRTSRTSCIVYIMTRAD